MINEEEPGWKHFRKQTSSLTPICRPGAGLGLKTVRYSLPVRLFHPRLHAGLSRRFPSWHKPPLPVPIVCKSPQEGRYLLCIQHHEDDGQNEVLLCGIGHLQASGVRDRRTKHSGQWKKEKRERGKMGRTNAFILVPSLSSLEISLGQESRIQRRGKCRRTKG
jgi:hypothetical protein